MYGARGAPRSYDTARGVDKIATLCEVYSQAFSPARVYVHTRSLTNVSISRELPWRIKGPDAEFKCERERTLLADKRDGAWRAEISGRWVGIYM